MKDTSQSQLLVKILIGVAWLDGEIQPEEREYLAKIARLHELDEATEIHPLLDGTMTITQADCEHWIQGYRSNHDDSQLLEAISGLIYSDGDVATAEAKLLMNIQPERIKPTLKNARMSPLEEPHLLTKIRRLYQKWLTQHG